MKTTLFGFLLCVPLFAAGDSAKLEKTLQESYEACHHWAGEVSGEETKERVAEINKGVADDCKAARKRVDRALALTSRSELASAYVLRIIDCCRTAWGDKTDWNKKAAPLCEATLSHFKKLGSTDPDAQSTYLSLCPKQAKEAFKKGS